MIEINKISDHFWQSVVCSYQLFNIESYHILCDLLSRAHKLVQEVRTNFSLKVNCSSMAAYLKHRQADRQTEEDIGRQTKRQIDS